MKNRDLQTKIELLYFNDCPSRKIDLHFKTIFLQLPTPFCAAAKFKFYLTPFPRLFYMEN